MASQIDVAALTLNPEEETDVSQAVFEKTFVTGELADVHDIQTGIQHKQQIVFIDQLDVNGEAFTGCVPVEQTGLTLTEKFWDPALIGGRWTHCAEDLDQLTKLFKKAERANPDHFDRIDSEELGIVMTRIMQSMKTSVGAKAWLSDKAAAAQPGGNFTASGFNAGLWNQIDGLWQQIFADGNIPVYTISENAGASYAAQELSVDEGQTILRQLYENADSRLLGEVDAQILVTRSIWDNYLITTENTQGQGGIIERQENGVTKLDFRGIPVKRMDDWDRTIRKYQDTTTAWYRPHRALLTTEGNIPLGTLNESDLETLTSFYFQKDLSNIMDVAYYLDAKFGESYLASAAY
jgi:hypothetical protein